MQYSLNGWHYIHDNVCRNSQNTTKLSANSHIHIRIPPTGRSYSGGTRNFCGGI